MAVATQPRKWTRCTVPDFIDVGPKMDACWFQPFAPPSKEEWKGSGRSRKSGNPRRISTDLTISNVETRDLDVRLVDTYNTLVWTMKNVFLVLLFAYAHLSFFLFFSFLFFRVRDKFLPPTRGDANFSNFRLVIREELRRGYSFF